MEVSSAISLPKPFHHGILVRLKPILDPNLLYFKVEVSADNGTTWHLYDDRLAPYDHRYLVLPYRNQRFGFAAGRNYTLRICADYGTETQCALSSSFILPTVTVAGSQGLEDADDDILSTEREYNLGTDPRNPDSDEDQMADPYEVSRNLDPNLTQKPVIIIHERALDFGAGTPYGTQNSQHRLFTIMNEGERVLRVSNGILSGGGASAFQYPNEVFELLPRQGRTAVIDFLPTSPGRFEASLDILSDDAQHFPVSISLSGMASNVAGFRVESDARLSFSATRVGEDSAPKTVTILNPDGDRPVDVSIFTQHTLNFLAIPPHLSLAPGERRTVDLIFAPEWAGSYEGLLEIRAGNVPAENARFIPMVARAEGPLPRLRPLPASVNFGRIASGTVVKRQLVIFNDGEGPLVIKKIDFGAEANGSPGDFSLSSTSFVVPPGGSNRVEISFSPSRAGDIASQLCLITNDSRVLANLSTCRVARSMGGGISWPESQAGLVLSGSAQ